MKGSYKTMENKCKRFLSLLLALVMVLGMFPMTHAHAVTSATVSATPITEGELEANATYVIRMHGTAHRHQILIGSMILPILEPIGSNRPHGLIQFHQEYKLEIEWIIM